MRTFAARTRSRTWTDCGRGCGRGLDTDTDTDWMRTRTGCGHGRGADVDWMRTGHGHGQQAGGWRGHPASKPRPLRGRRILHWRRSKACTREKPSGEGNKGRRCAMSEGVTMRQTRCRRLPCFDTAANAARFVGRMANSNLQLAHPMRACFTPSLC